MEKHVLRYILEVKEPYTYFDYTGKPTPVHAWRWRGQACSDDIDLLRKMIVNQKNCQIIDRQTGAIL